MHTDWFSAEHNRGRDHLGPGAAYRELCDALPLFVWVLDASGAAVYANRPFLAYTGMQPGDVRGDGLLSALHPEDRAHTTTALMDAVRTGSDFTLEQRVRSREGNHRRFLVACTALREPDGRATRWLATCTDIEEQKRAEERQRFLAQAGSDLASCLDYLGTLRLAAQLCVPTLADWALMDHLLPSGAFERLEAASMLQGDIVREVRDFVPDYAQSGSLQSRALMEGRPLFLPEVDHASLLELTHGPAHVSLFERSDVRSLVSVPLRARGRTMGVLTLARGMGRRRFDATELGLAEELAARAALAADNARLYREAQDAVRVRDDFMAIASHELLTPLTSLSLQTDGAVRLVRSGDGAVLPRVATRVDAIRAQVTRLSQLVHELLDVSRIASGRMPVQPEWIDLAALVRDVVERCREEAERAGCALTLQAPAPVFGMWDKLRLDQVVTNLVMNAIKYGRTRPVGVAVELHRGRARLVVRDQGIGIDKAHHVRIFERFERAVSQRNYGGLGLGLWIARQIVEACGGRIRVISEVGQGATFTVDLPCGLPAEAGADVNVG